MARFVYRQSLASMFEKTYEMPYSAVFLDRDGVINYDYGHTHKIDNFHFVDGIFDLAGHAYNLGYKLVVVTNQSGIARGYYTEDQFRQLSNWMCERFAVAGAPIERVYHSPYHPTAGIGRYRRDDISRKPNPGMILQAQKDLSIDLSRSVLIGDKPSDIQAGTAAGVGRNLLFAAQRPNELRNLNYELITTLRDAINYL